MHDPDVDRLTEQMRALAEDGSRQAVGLPSEQVRALGVRRNHRQVASRTLFVVIVAVALVGGVATMTGRLPGISVMPAAPPPSTIPTELALDANPPADINADLTEGPGEGLVLRRYAPCDPDAHASLVQLPQDWVLIDSTTMADQVRGIHYQDADLDQVRLVQLYGDVSVAERVMQQVRDAVASCPTMERQGPNGTVERNDFTVVDADVGDDGVLTTSRWFAGDGTQAVPGAELRYIVRVGSVIVMVSELNRGITDPAALAQLAAELQRTAEGLVAELCAFADRPC